MYIAAFAVSSYAQSSYRLGNKPFNPLLGETYECIREDKGWRFVSEQVNCCLVIVSARMSKSQNILNYFSGGYSVNLLLLPRKEPSKIAADDTYFFFFYLLKKLRLDVSCESS